MVAFFEGAAAMGCAMAGMFFLRFWRQSLDSFFFLFALAFLILAFDYGLLGLVTLATEWQPYVYAIRLTAFLLILAAIVRKNRS